jgi:hypothetical protein
MSYDNLSSVSQNVLKFYQQLTGEERRVPSIFHKTVKITPMSIFHKTDKTSITVSTAH